MSTRTVLIVDDQPDNREVVAIILRAHGYSVLEAENGADALNVLSANRPCVILLDLTMPVMDGWRFRSEQLARPDLQSIPVVLYSAHSELDKHAAALGATAVLRKPIDIADLAGVVDSACHGPDRGLTRASGLKESGRFGARSNRHNRPPLPPKHDRWDLYLAVFAIRA